ncbi:PDDEXK family nuclease [Herbaspirillum camelliae]|uniref:TnsA endonuclease N-terminal domain-containing protein n=1 Tax=Herbaspirillum camelliae TaxID=1892903 RepID=UPI000B0537CB|nr:TnsA endonuclease N-terminal domain-containing protein [Herbaspirillum camelliae]
MSSSNVDEKSGLSPTPILNGQQADVSAPAKPRRASPRSPQQRQKRALSQNRGLGDGEAYQSFIRVERSDFSSRGLSTIWLDPLNPKLVSHLLSDLERYVLLHLAAVGATLKSQYPLWRAGVEPEFLRICASPDEGTVRIAKELGFKHPVVGGETMVLTVDLLAVLPGGQFLAIYAKYEKDLPAQGTRGYELYLIAKEYWRRRSTEMLVLTERGAKIDLVLTWLEWASSIRGMYVVGSASQLLALVDRLVCQTDSELSMNSRFEFFSESSNEIVHALKYAIWVGRVFIEWPNKADLTLCWDIRFSPTANSNGYQRIAAMATKL